MSMAHDETRRSLARLAGLVLIAWGACWAALWICAGVGFGALELWRAGHGGGGGDVLLAAVAIIVGLVAGAIGGAKAWAGWILVQDDPKLDAPPT
jgi:hypothetical protein